MGRRISYLDVAACLVTGLALWFTRASLDVASGLRGDVRVAMFPSWAELAGLIMLASAVVLLLSRLPDRLPPKSRHRTSRPVDPLLPLLALPCLALPYVPWLPDVFPVLQVLAGPARYGIWAVVLGQVLWLTWQQARDERRPPSAESRALAVRTLGVAAVAAAAFGVAAAVLVRGPLYPGGDEPHYLVITQSLLRDGDLRIEDNHARGDYRAYFNGALKPDFITRGRDGAIYSIHPIGLPVLIAPAFALGGYAAVSLLLVVIAALAAGVAWRRAVGSTGSPTAATVGWLAVAGSGSFVLHSFAVYPEVAAAAAVITAFAWRPGTSVPHHLAAVAHGLLVGALPWLGTKYAPMSGVLALVVAARYRSRRGAVTVLAAYATAVILWLAFFQYVWGSFLPTAPYGAAHQTHLRHLIVGLPALLFDQEYGLLPYAPGLLLAAPGLRHMWTRGGATRREALEIAVLVATLMCTVAAYAMWWGGSSAPARQIVAVLPLLVVPVAWWDTRAAARPGVSAAGRALVLAGLAVTAALVSVRAGALAANRRDGSSQWLEWLAPSLDLVRAAPSFIANREALGTPLLITAMWIAAAIGLAVVLTRTHRRTERVAPLVAVPGLLTAGVVTATIVPAAMGSRVPARSDPGARAESSMLATFDARRRPAAIVYDMWQRVPPADVPALFTFQGRPGLRRDPQPLRVLLNTRLALPAGQYDVRLVPAGTAGLNGSVGLQLGRTGRPVSEWRAVSGPGEAWTQEFRVDVDTPFVGFRTSAALEDAVGELLVRPRAVVNASERLDRYLALPPVLAVARYGDVAVYFHGVGAYPEAEGFWVRGATDLTATFARAPDDTRPHVRLKLHTGSAANRIRFRTGAWQAAVHLRPGEAGEVDVPLLPSARRAVVHIETEGGFVPAKTTGGTDRRLLGCWIEVVD